MSELEKSGTQYFKIISEPEESVRERAREMYVLCKKII